MRQKMCNVRPRPDSGLATTWRRDKSYLGGMKMQVRNGRFSDNESPFF